MQYEWTYDELVNLFRPFRSDVWKNSSLEEQEQALQNMADFYAQRILGVKRLCTVHLRQFFNDGNGRYEPSINEIILREDMAQRGIVESIYGDIKTYEFPSKHMFFYLMHEFKHAVQEYYKHHPEQCKDKTELLLIRNNKISGVPESNSYFKSTPNDTTKISISVYQLYTIQPVERYAWEFAHQEAMEFEHEMAKMFPDDRAFHKETKYSAFYETIEEAKMWFVTMTPQQDVDNILLTMNGNFVELPLNGVMCKAIKETQHPSMYERIKTQQAINQQIIEERNAAREAETQNVDVDDLFQDYDGRSQ